MQLKSKYTIMIFIISNFDGFDMGRSEAKKLISIKSLINLKDSLVVQDAQFVGNYTVGFKLYLTLNNIKYVVATTSVEPESKRFFNLDRAIKKIQIQTNIKQFSIEIKD
ncbi:hypothetical protein A7L18_17100 [Acinetobacter baumannii]|nr:hypothetical protein [Acinetobacter baumannii]MDR8256492.1 hypothetical protein [Acinetobacter baumannii]MDT1826792.1 hypothetical protein [Acinetobacter baumannii]MDT1851534.1 hypothetical protein [Acinetobacter baumannii]OIB87861.1 hypothetical protein A7L18_17100 [Acinetobacter baumannii]